MLKMKMTAPSSQASPPHRSTLFSWIIAAASFPEFTSGALSKTVAGLFTVATRYHALCPPDKSRSISPSLRRIENRPNVPDAS
jgi:hypothetical protein